MPKYGAITFHEQGRKDLVAHAKKRGFTQRYVAEKVGLTATSLHQVLPWHKEIHGTAGSDKGAEICEVIGLPIHQVAMLHDSDEKLVLKALDLLRAHQPELVHDEVIRFVDAVITRVRAREDVTVEQLWAELN